MRSTPSSRRSPCLLLASAALWLTLSAGCAQMTAGMQPPPLNRDILAEGSERAQVVGALGAPLSADEARPGEVLLETYRYRDGGTRNSDWSKAGRIIVYTAGDVFTLFLSQVIWIPLEIWAFAPRHYATDVYYQNSGNRWVLAAYREVDGETGNVVRQHAPDLWARLEPIPEAEPDAALADEQASVRPPEERLRALETLLEDGLIEPDEYQARREAILDDL